MAVLTTNDNSGPAIEGGGLAIRHLRQEKGLSLRQLAEQVGWDRGRLSKYETNVLRLSSDAIEKLAAALGVIPEAIVVTCLQYKYPRLSDAESRAGKLLRQLVTELSTESITPKKKTK